MKKTIQSFTPFILFLADKLPFNIISIHIHKKKKNN